MNRVGAAVRGDPQCRREAPRQEARTDPGADDRVDVAELAHRLEPVLGRAHGAGAAPKEILDRSQRSGHVVAARDLRSRRESIGPGRAERVSDGHRTCGRAPAAGGKEDGIVAEVRHVGACEPLGGETGSELAQERRDRDRRGARLKDAVPGAGEVDPKRCRIAVAEWAVGAGFENRATEEFDRHVERTVAAEAERVTDRRPEPCDAGVRVPDPPVVEVGHSDEDRTVTDANDRTPTVTRSGRAEVHRDGIALGVGAALRHVKGRLATPPPVAADQPRHRGVGEVNRERVRIDQCCVAGHHRADVSAHRRGQAGDLATSVSECLGPGTVGADPGLEPVDPDERRDLARPPGHGICGDRRVADRVEKPVGSRESEEARSIAVDVAGIKARLDVGDRDEQQWIHLLSDGRRTQAVVAQDRRELPCVSGKDRVVAGQDPRVAGGGEAVRARRGVRVRSTAGG